jgi:hypothetical protein
MRMRLRNIGAWLIPPLALVAAGLPHIRSFERGAELGLLKPTNADLRKDAPARPISSRPSAIVATRPLDSYDNDACHLLWKFAEANRPLMSSPTDLDIAVSINGQKGQVSLDENAKASSKRGRIRNCDLKDVQFTQDFKHFPIKFMIATLPDPKYSHSTEEFDSGIEALQAAVADAGYSLDSFYLPWDPLHLSPVEPANAKELEMQPGLILFKRKCAEDEECDYRLLLTFLIGETPTTGVQRLALSSALEQTWRVAAEFPQDRSVNCHSKLGCSELSLLAPFFTGSTFSLVETLRHFDAWLVAQKVPGHPLKVTIISGSATAVDQKGFLPLEVSQALLFQNPTFRATEGYNPEMRDAFVSEYLSGTLGARPEEIAILRESGTGYGQNSKNTGTLVGFLRFLNNLIDHPDNEESKAASALLPQVIQAAGGLQNKIKQARNDKDKRKAKRNFYDLLQGKLDLLELHDPMELRYDYQDSLKYLDMPFPIHISELRGAEEAKLMSQPTSLSFAPQVFFPAMTTQTEGQDSIPPFSDLDKTAADRVMANLLGTLAREDYHFVGIYATDPQDIIYLAQQVRRRCPDTLLFTFGADLLFVNPDVVNDLRGMLVITTYPLITLNQHWTYPWMGNENHHQFVNDSAEGVYNATMALLDRAELMLEYESPFALPDYGRPPGWIMAVGKESLQPIALLPQTSPLSDRYQYTRQLDTATEANNLTAFIYADRIARSWATTLLFWAGTIFCIWFAWFSMWPGFLKDRGIVWRSGFRERGSRRTLALETFLLSLLLSYMLIAALMLAGGVTCDDCMPMITLSHFGLATLFGGATIITLLFLGISPSFQFLKLSVSGIRGAITKRGWPGMRAIPEAISAVASLLVPVIGIMLAANYLGSLAGTQAHASPLTNARVVFSALRYQTPGNGVSAFPPLFFAAITIVLWSASCVRRIGMLESMTGEPQRENAASAETTGSYLGLDCNSLADIPKREAEIRSLLSRGALRLPLRSLLLIFLVATFIFAFRPLSLDVITSVEGEEFDRLYSFLLVAAYTAIAFNFLRFVDVWNEFHRLLRRISWCPLREGCAAFGDLGTKTLQASNGTSTNQYRTQIPPLALTSRMPTLTALQFSVEQAERLVTKARNVLKAGGPTTALTNRIASYEAKLNEALKQARSQLALAFDAHAQGTSVPKRQAIVETQRSLANIASYTTSILDPDWWSLEGTGSQTEEAEGVWVRQAHNYLSSRILDYSRHILAQLRNLLNFSTLGFMTMLLSVSAYPFLRSDTLLRISWMMLLLVVALGVWIFLQMKRDRILSLLAGETPGQIDWNSAVIGHLALYGLLPMLTIIGVQFPATLEGIVNSVLSVLSGSHP